ncbi:MAG: hypothetical protein WC798_01020 [Candidatus Paceibacterota bacterium]|jgi:hypothetical protein
MLETCSGTQASDRFGITLDFVTKLHNGSISEEEAKRFLRREEPFVKKESVPVPPAKHDPLFSVSATTSLAAIKEKKTKKCFTGSRWTYRDSDFDNWLPADQPNADACTITTLAPSREWTFIEAAVAVLGIIGIDTNTDVATIGEYLIKQGHTMTLAEAEEMVEKTEKSEETGMRTDGYGNFFFIETGNPKNPVSVGYVSRDGRGWGAGVRSLGRGYRWSADYRLLVRNLDTQKL